MSWLNNGQSVKVPVGNYRIEFKELEGFQTPLPIVVGIIKNQTTNVNVEYVPVVNGPWGDRGVFIGGYQSSIIDYITITTKSNATLFGYTSLTGGHMGACSNGTRGVFAGSWGVRQSVIQYITISTLNNSSDFGSLIVSRFGIGACSNETRGLFAGGYGSTNHSLIEYVTIATTSIINNFGYLAVDDKYGTCGVSNGNDRGVFAGSYWTPVKMIEYCNINTLSNTILFGYLLYSELYGRSFFGSASNETRGVFVGDHYAKVLKNIEYITFSTLGNGTLFGELINNFVVSAGCSNKNIGVFTNGSVLEDIVISILSNASSFGNLSQSRSYLTSACSGN